MDKLEYFVEISRIPRASFNEKAVVDYIENVAHEHNLKTHRDEIHNLVVYKDGTLGYEDHPIVIIQSHVDMVAEKTPESTHDFSQDPIELFFDGDWVHADNTTLGADDGYGVSYMLEIMTNPEIEHPPLELVFTVQEEFGLAGAIKFDMFPVLKGRRFIGLDNVDEELTCVSCSGGLIGEVKVDIEKDEVFESIVSLKVNGLKGGHSGMDIDKELGNSIKIAGEILHRIRKSYEVGLTSLEGGSKNNAIPRDCQMKFGILDADKEDILELIDTMVKGYKAQYSDSDEGLEVEVEVTPADGTLSMDSRSTKKFAKLLLQFPNGVYHMSMSIEDLVMLSCNLAVVETESDRIRIEFYARTPQEFMMNKMKDMIEAATEGYELNYLQQFPGWNYEKDSFMRTILQEEYVKKFGREIEIVASHGGMEPGVFKDKLPGLDPITLGPTAEGIHSPQERMNIPSFDRVFELLKNILKRL